MASGKRNFVGIKFKRRIRFLFRQLGQINPKNILEAISKTLSNVILILAESSLRPPFLPKASLRDWRKKNPDGARRVKERGSQQTMPTRIPDPSLRSG